MITVVHCRQLHQIVVAGIKIPFCLKKNAKRGSRTTGWIKNKGFFLTWANWAGHAKYGHGGQNQEEDSKEPHLHLVKEIPCKHSGCHGC